MKVRLDGHAQGVVLLDGEGRTLSITLDPDEALAEATLTLSRADAATPKFSGPAFATDKGESLAAITWISADWGATRTLAGISLPSLSSAAALKIRLQIARGSSAWYSPPGPHTFELPAGPDQSLTASLPDTVADRVMLEFLTNPQMTIQTVTLKQPPVIRFGARARDITLGVRGKRQLFAVDGEPAGPVEVPGLLDALRGQGVGLTEPTTIDLLLRAGAAGNLGVTWRFVADKICASFLVPDPSPTAALTLAWDGHEEVAIAVGDAGPFDVFCVELALTHEPTRERLLLGPSKPPPTRSYLGELVRPADERGQRIELAEPGQIVGVSIWGRPLGDRVTALATLHADDGGAPASTPLTAARLESIEPEVARGGPRWIDLDFTAPVDVQAGPLWLVLGSEAGEFVWILDSGRPVGLGELRQRRNGGAWLARDAMDADRGVVLRVRARELGALPPPTAALVLRGPQGEESFPLVADTGGTMLGAMFDAVGPFDGASLRVRASVAAAVSLAGLRLRWRPVE